VNSRIESAFDKVYDTQKIYRQLLDALARPGKVCTLPELEIQPPTGLSKPLAGITFTLLDSETTFSFFPQNDVLEQYTCLNTGAKASLVPKAEFIIVDGMKDFPLIEEINRGTLLSPELGSTVLLMVDQVSIGGTGTQMTLSGPGIKGQIKVVIAGLLSMNLERIVKLNQEYPLGVDLFFVDPRGQFTAVPRSSLVQWEEVS